MATLLAGCSNGDDTAVDDIPAETPVTAEPTSPEAATESTDAGNEDDLTQYLAEANEVCSEMVRHTDEILSAYEPDGPQGGREIATVLSAQARVIEQTMADLRRLTPPPDHHDTVAGLHAQVDDLVELADEVAAAAAAGDDAEFQALFGELQARANEINAAYRSFGLDTCAE